MHIRKTCRAGAGAAEYQWLTEPLCERHVQALWYDLKLRPQDIATRDGERVEVVSPGEWNAGPGPDFKGAVLVLGKNRRRLCGDVEIHLKPSGWDAHGHGSDSAYSNVIAHVTWMCGPDPGTLPPGAVTIWLGRYFAGESGFSPDQIDLASYPLANLPLPDRPCRDCIGSSHELASAVLASAGRRRMHLKARRFRALLSSAAGDRRQVFYSEMLSVFGYKGNEAQFRRLAAAVPCAEIEREPSNAGAAFSSAAGFIRWNRVSTRPRNSPARRITAAAALFSRGSAMFLADVASFAPSALKAMMRILVAGGAMGRGRAAAAIANVVLPFALAEGRIDEPAPWLPPEDLSSPVRLAASRMFGRDHYPAAWYATNGLYIQGLVQIHRDFCLKIHPDCENCALAREAAAVLAQKANENRPGGCALSPT